MTKDYLVDGARLAYADTGVGTPVVFLHPTPLDHVYWEPLIAELGGVRAIAPDFRGHGASELGEGLPAGEFAAAPDAPVLSVGRLALDVLKLLEHLEVATAVFVGCSIGGYVLLELWRRAPERMRGLVFVCSKAQADTEAGLAKRAANIALVRAEGTAGLFDGMARSLIGATAQKQRPGIVEELQARMTLTPEAAIAVQAGLATRPDSLPTVKTIDVPVLAIAGGEDGAVTAAEMEAFREAPGECEFHLIADAGHFAAYEQPERVAGMMREWLGQFRD
jgi:pimeloyl-ACP methyl ester carboxylesterase